MGGSCPQGAKHYGLCARIDQSELSATEGVFLPAENIDQSEPSATQFFLPEDIDQSEPSAT